MTKNDLKRIALQVGASEFYPETQTVKEQNYIVGQMFLERFANLVRQETLESAALEFDACGRCADSAFIRALKNNS